MAPTGIRAADHVRGVACLGDQIAATEASTYQPRSQSATSINPDPPSLMVVVTKEEILMRNPKLGRTRRWTLAPPPQLPQLGVSARFSLNSCDLITTSNWKDLL
jgi:hypothetical protein